MSGLCDTCVRALDSTQASPATPDAGVFPVPLDSSVRESVATVSHHPAGVLTTTGTPVVAGSTSTDVSPSSARARARMPLSPAGYDLIVRLGGGGMGDVYLAREKHADRLVAMKFLRLAGSPGRLERFLNELRALAAFDHSNIVRVFTSDLERVEPYITTEFAAGGTLGDWIETHGPLEPKDAARLTATLARAIATVHERKVIHRDLKPSNILLVTPGKSPREVPPEPRSLAEVTPKVADFGLAKLLDEEGFTPASGMLGTPNYMPPEQITNRNGELGPASDVYGLGATLFHSLTGQPPFGRGEKEEILFRVVSDPVPRPRAVRPDLPLELDGIVVKCLEKDPQDRYSSAAALADDLDRFQAGIKPAAPALTGWRRTRRWAVRNRQPIAWASFGLLLAAGLVATGMALVPILFPDEAPLQNQPVVFPEPPQVLGPPVKQPIRFLGAVMPEDELRKEARRTEIETKLAAQMPVTLVAEKGLPSWHRWALGGTQLTVGEDGTCQFESVRAAMLELLHDPGIERYRVTADLRLLAVRGAPDAKGTIQPQGANIVPLGFYFSYFAPPVADRVPGRFAVTVSYNDYPDPIQMQNVPPEARLAVAQVRSLLHLSQPIPGRDPGGLESFGRPIRFAPVSNLPGFWRRVRIDVSPSGVNVFWMTPTEQTKPGDRMEQIAVLSTADLNARYVAMRERLEQAVPGNGASPPAWSPRMPLGVWCSGGAVAMRNVVVEPLP